MSSSRHIPRFIVLFSSGHRWLFFVASLWAYVVVASFLCLRVVGFSLHTWVGTCISYTFPFLLGTLLLCYPVTLVTLLPYCSVPSLLCPFVTLLPSSLVPLLLCCQFFNFSVFLHDKSQFFFPVWTRFLGRGVRSWPRGPTHIF